MIIDKMFKKKNNVKISVIIPTYNAAKHMKVSLDSLAKQTIGVKNFEILMVDDQSTDDTVDVAKSYEGQFPNFDITVLPQNSGGPMVPRNNAIDRASGEFIMFMDNDDYLREETLERFYNAAVKYGSDVIFGKYVGVNGRIVPVSQFDHGNQYHADIEADNLVHTLAPHKMFKRSFVERLGLRFNPEVFIGEDQYFVYTAMVNAKVITVLADYNYYYVVNHTDDKADSTDEFNLSRIQNKMPAKKIYTKIRYIMAEIDKSDNTDEKKTKYKQLMLQRELLIHASKVYSTNKELQDEFLTALKEDVVSFVTPEIYSMMNPDYRAKVDIINQLDGRKLNRFKYITQNIHSQDVVRVDNEGIFADVNGELFNFVLHNKTQPTLYDVHFSEETKKLVVDAGLEDMLTPENEAELQIELENRATKEIHIIESTHQYTRNGTRAVFEIEIPVVSNKTVFDLFVVRNVSGLRQRRRLGANRLMNRTAQFKNGKAYYTKGPGNLSLELISD